MIEKTFIKQGLKKLELDDYLTKELERAGFTKSEIMKTPLVTRIVVNVTRPGLAIGKSGSNIAQLTKTIEERFGIDNPQLEIKEIENPSLDAQAVANKLKALIEKGFSWRSVVFKSANEMNLSGCQGYEIILSGKLAGKGGRKRKQRIAAGYMKKVGEQAKLVDYGAATAYPKVGAIGIKVKIVKPETKFPDKIDIKEIIKNKDAADKLSSEEHAKVKAEENKTDAEEAVVETETKTEVKTAEKNATEVKAEAKEKPVKEKATVKKETKATEEKPAEKKAKTSVEKVEEKKEVVKDAVEEKAEDKKEAIESPAEETNKETTKGSHADSKSAQSVPPVENGE